METEQEEARVVMDPIKKLNSFLVKEGYTMIERYLISKKYTELLSCQFELEAYKLLKKKGGIEK